LLHFCPDGFRFRIGSRNRLCAERSHRQQRGYNDCDQVVGYFRGRDGSPSRPDASATRPYL
jgi:hypothetical protein